MDLKRPVALASTDSKAFLRTAAKAKPVAKLGAWDKPPEAAPVPWGAKAGRLAKFSKT